MSASPAMPCLVVDVSDFEAWGTHHSGGSLLPGNCRPTVLHLSREVAELEAKRLAAAHPSRTFCVLEAAVLAACVKVPTHVTLGGKVVRETQRPMLIDLADDPNALPF